MAEIHVIELLAARGQDTAANQAKIEQCQALIANANAVIEDVSGCEGQSYQAAYDYLSQAHIPALYLHLGFFRAFDSCVVSDLVQLALMVPDACTAGLFSTLAIDAAINALKYENMMLAIRSSTLAGMFGMLAVPSSVINYQLGINQSIIDANNAAIAVLEEYKGIFTAYAGSSALYAEGIRAADAMLAASTALSQARYDSETRCFDLSAVSDWSWQEDARLAYCAERNRQILEGYFVYGPGGRVVDIRPEGVELLDKLAGLAAEDPFSLGDLEQHLSPEEKYAVLWMACNLADPAFAAGNFFLDRPLAHELASGFAYPLPPGMADLLYDGTGGLIDFRDRFGPVTDLFSFVPAGGHYSSTDHAGSIQHGSGFADWYDPAVPILGMDIGTQVVVFESGGREYRLQGWDGVYGYGLLYGGEVGLYCRDIEEARRRPYIRHDPETLRDRLSTLSAEEVDSLFINYGAVPPGVEVPIRIIIYDQDGNMLFENNGSPDGTDYWNFGCKPMGSGQYGREDITMDSIITVPPSDFRDDFEDALDANGIDYDVDGNRIIIHWDCP